MEPSETNTGLSTRSAMEEKVENLIKELKEIQARVPTMDERQRERYVSLSKRLIALQEQVRSPRN